MNGIPERGYGAWRQWHRRERAELDGATAGAALEDLHRCFGCWEFVYPITLRPSHGKYVRVRCPLCGTEETVSP